MSLLARIRDWLDCRKGLHVERRLRKGELATGPIMQAIALMPGDKMPSASMYRICDRCGKLRAVKARKRKVAA